MRSPVLYCQGKEGNRVIMRGADRRGGRSRCRAAGRPGFVLVLLLLSQTIALVPAQGAQGPAKETTSSRTEGAPRLTRLTTGLSAFRQLTVVGDTLFFRARDARGTELWRSDGTADGTRRVADINPGPADSRPGSLTAMGNVVYFAADDGIHGRELWRSDGTRGGTDMVADIKPVSDVQGDSSMPSDMMVVDEVLYFQAADVAANEELWRSDGTTAGTYLVAEIDPDIEGSFPTSLTPKGTAFFFWAHDDPYGTELWRSDGTAVGTTIVKDINPGAGGTLSGPPHFKLALLGETLLFRAFEWDHGAELWRSDGTASGTELVKDINSGPGGMPSYPTPLLAVGDRLYFRANDGDHGAELWRSDGTEDGTRLVDDINVGWASSTPFAPARLGGVLYFWAFDEAHGRALWRSDGTGAGTYMVADLSIERRGPARLYGITVAGSSLYTAARNGAHGTELWRSDGTAAGTRMVADLNPGPRSSNPKWRTALGDALYFSAQNRRHGRELWVLR